MNWKKEIGYNEKIKYHGKHQVIIAVVDNGLYIAHNNIGNNLWRHPKDNNIHGFNFSDSSSTNSFDLSPSDNHGTGVAGLIAASNGIGIASECCTIMAIKLFPNNGNLPVYLSDLMRSWLISRTFGADVINNSIMIHPNHHDEDDIEVDRLGGAGHIIHGVMKFLYQYNCSLVFSAGQEMELLKHIAEKSIIVTHFTSEDHKPYDDEEEIDIAGPGGNLITISISSPCDLTTLSSSSAAAGIISGVIGLLKSNIKEVLSTNVDRMILSLKKNGCLCLDNWEDKIKNITNS